jgi:DNA-binding NtrC family response regulator
MKTLEQRLDRFKARVIKRALLSTGGRIYETARVLGIKHETLRANVKRYGLAKLCPRFGVGGRGNRGNAAWQELGR